MTSTKDFDRYYTPQIEKLVQELKEARERRTKVVNDFQYRVNLHRPAQPSPLCCPDQSSANQQVFAEFDKDYSTWMTTIKVVAELDCLLSLSKSSAALGEPSVRPEIVESDAAIVEFEELRHPCVFRSACVSSVYNCACLFPFSVDTAVLPPTLSRTTLN
jgi:DNA mismatch repair protein MSH6